MVNEGDTSSDPDSKSVCEIPGAGLWILNPTPENYDIAARWASRPRIFAPPHVVNVFEGSLGGQRQSSGCYCAWESERSLGGC